MGLIRRITEYLFVEDCPEKSDAIFIPGSPYREPAEKAARLFQDGYAPLLVPSGDRWLFTRRGGAAECDAMAAVLAQAGVPGTAILGERRARHTLDNARLSRAALDGVGITVKTAIVCCQSFHARRCMRAYRRYFPQARLLVCPVSTRGFNATSWFKSPIGIFKVITELLKCTGLFFFLISLAKVK